MEKGHSIQVHNYGYVRLVDFMGSDKDVVEAARVSYASGSKGDEADKKLIKYLLKNKHTSPFEMVKVKFNIKLPIFVMRQLVRHRMQQINEVSARYTEVPNEFFVPETFRANNVKNKQSSGASEEINQHECKSVMGAVYDYAYDGYLELLRKGVSREQARCVLPVGIYTEIYSCWDMNNLLKFFALRDEAHAQAEIQDYARSMKTICRDLFPWTMEAYDDIVNV